MQITKEHTRALLQQTAQEAFLRKGFKAVSMREISKLSGVSLSNIYNYFPCKEDLLAVVLSPLFEAMDNLWRTHNSDENLTLDIYTSEAYHRQAMRQVMGIITRYRKELRLLFLDTQETRFRDYCEQWVERGTVIGMEYLERMKELYPELYTSISPFFIHFTCSWWVNMMKEIVLHKDLTAQEVERFIGEYIHFSIGGWKRLMNVEGNVEQDKSQCCICANRP